MYYNTAVDNYYDIL